MSGRVIILNSDEEGTRKHDAALVELARRGIPRLLQHCDAMEAQGRATVSIEWLRASFEDWGRQIGTPPSDPDDEDLPVLVTAAEAAVLAQVEPATIRRWKARKKLRPVGRTPDGRNLFTLPAVFGLRRGDDPRNHWRT